MSDQLKAEEAPRFLIKGQYVKDLSFENPHSPHSLIALEDKPKIDFSIDLKMQRFNEQHFELTLHLTARAMGQTNTLFLVELDYSGIVQFVNIPEEKVEPILCIDCAFILFPFARRVLADVTRDGGFPPLMLDPSTSMRFMCRTSKRRLKLSHPVLAIFCQAKIVSTGSHEILRSCFQQSAG